MGDGHAGPGHQEHQRVATLAHVEVRTRRGPTRAGLRGFERGAGRRAHQAHRTGYGRLGAVRAAWTSRVSWRVSSTLAGLRREVSRPWQQAITWSTTTA
jgi:hypothetical protein